MAERIWKDRCEDCYNKRELDGYAGVLLPPGETAELCAACAEVRAKEHAEGKEPRAIGLLPAGEDAEWMDLPQLVVTSPGGKAEVKVKYLRPLVDDAENGGEIRLQFPDQSKWLAGGDLDPEVFGASPPGALAEAKSRLRLHYFPGPNVEIAQAA